MNGNEKLTRVFEYALNQEQTGMSFFQASLERMGIGAAKTAFQRLIEEENCREPASNRQTSSMIELRKNFWNNAFKAP
mgnify:CR=1 FL=1